MPPYTYVIDSIGSIRRVNTRTEAKKICSALNNNGTPYTICRIDHINDKEEILTLNEL